MTYQVWGRLNSAAKLREYCAAEDENVMRSVFDTLRASGQYEELELRQLGLPVALLRWHRELQVAS